MNNIYPPFNWTLDKAVFAFEQILKHNSYLIFHEPLNKQVTLPSFLAVEAGYRIYTEWCMDESSDGGAKKSCSVRGNYSGQALTQFLNDEKLWEARDPKRGKNRTNSHDQECLRIIDAFARSSCEFFLRHCTRIKEPLAGTDYFRVNDGDRTNIRRCLSPWLDDPRYVMDQSD